MLLVIPYAGLVAAQYNAGPTAWIKLGVGGDDTMTVELGGGILRPLGLFTYTSPNVDFTAAAVAMFLSFHLSGARLPYRTTLLCASGLSVATMAE